MHTPPEQQAPLDVLLVEDEPDIAEVAEEVLTEAGHRVTHVMDATRALHLCRTQRFDAALIDIMLPGVDGLTLAHTLHRHWPGTALVATTALDDLPDAREAGLGHVLFKPFSPEQLTEVLAEAVAGARRRRAPAEASPSATPSGT